jgi:hypothetical protein
LGGKSAENLGVVAPSMFWNQISAHYRQQLMGELFNIVGMPLFVCFDWCHVLLFKLCVRFRQCQIFGKSSWSDE